MESFDSYLNQQNGNYKTKCHIRYIWSLCKLRIYLVPGVLCLNPAMKFDMEILILLRNKTELHNVSLTEHLILQAMNKGTTGPWGNEADSVCVQFLFGGVIGPLSTRGELSRNKEVFGPFMSCTLSLDTDKKGRKKIS